MWDKVAALLSNTQTYTWVLTCSCLIYLKEHKWSPANYRAMYHKRRRITHERQFKICFLFFHFSNEIEMQCVAIQSLECNLSFWFVLRYRRSNLYPFMLLAFKLHVLSGDFGSDSTEWKQKATFPRPVYLFV